MNKSISIKIYEEETLLCSLTGCSLFNVISRLKHLVNLFEK